MSVVSPPLSAYRGQRRLGALALAPLSAGLASPIAMPANPWGEPPRFRPWSPRCCLRAVSARRAPLADVVALEQAPDYGRLRLLCSLGFLGVALVAAAGSMGASVGIPLRSRSAVWPFFPRRWLPAVPGARAPGVERRRIACSRARFRLFLSRPLWLAAHAGYDLCITLHLRDLGASGRVVGAAWAIATGVEVAWMAGSARMLKVVAPQRLFAVGVAAAALRWLLLGSITQVWWRLLLQPLHACLWRCLYRALAHLRARSALSGDGSGAVLLCASLGACRHAGWGPCISVPGGSRFPMFWLVGSWRFAALLSWPSRGQGD